MSGSDVGTVIWFNPLGYGFIKPDNGGPDIFARVAAQKHEPGAEFAAVDRVRYELIAMGSPPKIAAIISARA
jgi:CspA family cold shock protein